jgi:hypothetical protein
MPETRARTRKIAENSHPGYTHHSTPTKAHIIGACKWIDAEGIKGKKISVFKLFGVSKARGWQILRDEENRRRFSVQNRPQEPRGRKPLLTPTDIRKMERIIEDADFESRSMTWDTLAYEAGLDVSPHTVQRAMGTLNYHKCIACKKGWVNKASATRRIEYAQVMLQRYPTQDNWKHVRFSDEVHIGVGPQGQVRVIRKPGERYCVNCIQYADEPNEEDKKKLHAWAAVGYSFKSPLVFYNIESNTNGKMTQKAYINQILEPVVKPWIQHHNRFILEEDQDSGHGTSKSNIVVDWKRKNHLESYFNCSNSPDLAPIENMWLPMKQYVRKFSHWDVETTEILAQEGWDSIKQRYINKQVVSMPKRLKDVVEGEGAMTGW